MIISYFMFDSYMKNAVKELKTADLVSKEEVSVNQPVTESDSYVSDIFFNRQESEKNLPVNMKVTPKVAAASTEKKDIELSSVKLSAVLDDYSNPLAIKDFEEKLGKSISTISFYKHFGIESNKLLSQSDLMNIKNLGKGILVAWEPWNPGEGLSQSRDYLTEINNGNFDEYIRQFAEGVKIYGNTITIRFGHEMNGNWYPWGKRPEEYKKAYTRIVDIFRTEGVENAKFMWSINAENVPYEDIRSVAQYYPGDSYVDSIGIDGFNFGTMHSDSKWRSFRETFYPAYSYIVKTYNKPIMFSEIASAEQGGNKAEWVRQMFNEMNSTFSEAKEIVWFNLNKETDWRIDSSEASLSSFRKSLSNTP